MALTQTPTNVREQIYQLMLDDIASNQQTGFDPYFKAGSIFFNHHWVYNLGIKRSLIGK